MIIISHVVKSEVMSYFNILKSVFVKSSLSPIIEEGEKFSEEVMSFHQQYVYQPIRNFMEAVIFKWAELFFSISRFFVSYLWHFCNFFNSIANFFLEYMFYTVFWTSALFVTVAMMRLRKVIISHIKIPEIIKLYFEQLRSIEYSKYRDQVLSSRFFWFTLGFCCHALWIVTEKNYLEYYCSLMRWMNLYEESMPEDMKNFGKEEENVEVASDNLNTQLAEIKEYDLFEQFDCTWIIRLLTAKLQDLIKFSYGLFISTVP